VYDITKKKYLSINDIVTVCMAVGLKTVPILENAYILPQTVQEILKDAEGRSVIADAEREGIVIRSHDQKVSFKAISNKFLMKEVE
jgi:ATP-dependent RNA circularization protein (DNA/RNA ligase family)